MNTFNGGRGEERRGGEPVAGPQFIWAAIQKLTVGKKLFIDEYYVWRTVNPKISVLVTMMTSLEY